MRAIVVTSFALACGLALPHVAVAQGIDFTWTEIPAPYAQSANVHFGSDVAWDGTRMVVRSDTRLDVYRFDGTSAPVFEANLVPVSEPEGYPGAVAIDAGRILTCANSISVTQHVLEFSLSGTTWSQVASLVNPMPTPGDGTIVGLAIDGPRFLVSAPYIGNNRGSVDVVHPPAAGPFTWTTANRAYVVGPNPQELTGHVIALHGSEAFVGVIQASVSGVTAAGRVILYRDDTTVLTPIRTLDNPSPAYRDQYGDDLDFDATNLYVGSHYDDTMGNDAGALYVYDRTGTLLQTLYGSVANGAYGGAIALGGGNWMTLGAPGTGSVASIGHIHLLQRDTAGTWHERADVTDLASMPGAYFGSAVVMRGRTIVVSSITAPVSGVTGAGRLWWGTYTVSDGGSCAADAECTHSHCISGICCNTACSGACDVCSTGTCQPMTCDAGITPIDAGTDGGSDAGTDAGIDGGNDAAMSMPDAGLDAATTVLDDAGVDASTLVSDASFDVGPLPDAGRDAGRADASLDAMLNVDAGGVPRTPLSCTCRASVPSTRGAPLLLLGLVMLAWKKRRATR